MTYCEDYPCCGHTPSDPCDLRSVITEPWYCDDCGFHHFSSTCPMDDYDDEEEEWADDAYMMEDQWLDGSYEE